MHIFRPLRCLCVDLYEAYFKLTLNGIPLQLPLTNCFTCKLLNIFFLQFFFFSNKKCEFSDFHNLIEFNFHTQKSQNHVHICMCVKTEMVALICRYPMNMLVDSIECKLPINKYTMNLINYFFLHALILIAPSESSDKKSGFNCYTSPITGIKNSMLKLRFYYSFLRQSRLIFCPFALCLCNKISTFLMLIFYMKIFR